jgi:hypothetical protein
MSLGDTCKATDVHTLSGTYAHIHTLFLILVFPLALPCTLCLFLSLSLYRSLVFLPFLSLFTEKPEILYRTVRAFLLQIRVWSRATFGIDEYHVLGAAGFRPPLWYL